MLCSSPLLRRKEWPSATDQQQENPPNQVWWRRGRRDPLCTSPWLQASWRSPPDPQSIADQPVLAWPWDLSPTFFKHWVTLQRLCSACWVCAACGCLLPSSERTGARFWRCCRPALTKPSVRVSQCFRRVWSAQIIPWSAWSFVPPFSVELAGDGWSFPANWVNAVSQGPY